jgi:serine protease
MLHTYFNTYRPPRADSFNYLFFQGTSMATPHVSGFAALLIQQGITSPAAIEAAMKQFATDIGRTGVDSEYGTGLINPRATLRGLGLAR